MTIYFFSIHNKPSGGTKVLNQMVNLCIEKGYNSSLVSLTNNTELADFLESPAPVITLNKFKEKCTKNDIVIDCWQHKLAFEAVTNCSSQKKIFWQHGVVIPKYKYFNSNKIYTSKIYNQYWNVSKACAEDIKDTYNIESVEIINPFFDDDNLLKYKDNNKTPQNKEGILCLRRRGQEAINDIINHFPNQKITILNKPFTDQKLYSELKKHKFFISFDNGIYGKPLIANKIKRFYYLLNKTKQKILSNNWIIPKNNLLGFPMTACESAWLGTTVIGFAMGGGLEWMNNDNMYLAKDGDINSLLEKLGEAVDDSEDNINRKIENAHKDVSKFNKENSWNQLTKSLNI